MSEHQPDPAASTWELWARVSGLTVEALIAEQDRERKLLATAGADGRRLEGFLLSCKVDGVALPERFFTSNKEVSAAAKQVQERGYSGGVRVANSEDMKALGVSVPE